MSGMQHVDLEMSSLEMESGKGAGGSKIVGSALRSIACHAKATVAMLVVLVALAIATMAVAANSTTIEKTYELHADSGLPGYEHLDWSQVEALARGTELNFYLWSPVDTAPRRWIDEVLSPGLHDKYGITVNRIDAVYAGCDLSGMALSCDVRDEVAAGATGAVDLVWINGANFKAMKDNDLLYGPFAPLLPNAVNFDFAQASNAYDFGTLTGGYEFPFHLSQVIFIHNSEHCPTPPTTIVEFIAWCKGAGAGKFVYSSDYTGTAFVKTVFYHYAGLASAGGTYEDFLVPFDQALFDSVEADVWAELNALEPYLYHPDAAGSYPHSEAAPYYPADHEDVRALVADETIWMDVSYNIAEASAQIQLREANDQDGWPDTMRPFLLSPGSIANTNFMAIPVNAPHAAAALVAVNHIGSPGEMFKRNTPEQWGALQAFDTTTETMKDWDLAFDYVETHHATPTVEALQAARVRELSPEWTTAIEASWNANVANSR